MSKPGSGMPPAGHEARESPAPVGRLPRPRLVGLILAGITLVVYWPLVRYGFVNYDDADYFASNWHVQEGLTLESVRWALGTGFAANWHPITWISLMLDAEIFGARAAGPHFVNLLLHVANTVLVFALLRPVTGAFWPSAVVGGLFALHPLHVESVAWISERKDVLSTFFALLTLWAYERYAHHTGSKRRWHYILALLFFALGLMSKPMLVTMPFVMLLLDYWPLRRMRVASARQAVLDLKRLAWEKIPFFALTAASCAITLVVQRGGGALRPLAAISIGARLENALVSYSRYIGKALWPANLAVLYPHPGHWPPGQVALAGTLLAAGCLVTLWTGRRLPFIATGWLLFLGALVPVIGLVQVGVQFDG